VTSLSLFYQRGAFFAPSAAARTALGCAEGRRLLRALRAKRRARCAFWRWGVF